MLLRSAESAFSRGMAALQEGRGLEATALFEAAIEIERRSGAARPQPRYLSYYGLCLGLEASRAREGVAFCREASAQEFYNADLAWNLGRVLIAANRRREAIEALEQGLRMQPSHAGILREMERLGRRRRPPIPFLSRNHPLNVALGKLTATSSSLPSPTKRTARHGTR